VAGSAFAAPAGRRIDLPLSPDQASELRSGEIVYLHGSVFTLLDKAFWRVFEDGLDLPLPMERLNAVVVGGGKVTATENGWIPDSLTPIPTTGARYFKWIPPLIERFGIKALVSKEGMGTNRAIREACHKHGAVALAAFSFPPKLLPDRCEAVEMRAWEELGGPEALSVYRVAGYGPLVVNIDTHGGCHAEEINERISANARSVYERYGLEAPQLPE
jgi:tartrate dehydratase beta subunit/fumarate hydratase class I family protein